MTCAVRHPANKREVSEIFSMLEICFPGMDRAYFTKRILGDSSYNKSNTFVLVKDHHIVSHAHLFNKRIWWKTGKIPFVGLGFICTLPEFRNRGYATELLRYVVKKKDAYLLGLFTKIPGYYKKLGFKTVPRKQFIMRRVGFRKLLASGIKIRRFSFSKDILPVINIHKNYFARKTGIVDRPFNDWKNQLSYFDENKRFFLVAESDGRLMAYLRCKVKNKMPDKAEIVEYASIDKGGSTILDFISYLFSKLNVNETSGWSHFLKPVLKNSPAFDGKIDDKMMIRFNKTYREGTVGQDEMYFLESDGF